MNSKIISRAACLAELTSNPKSFANCPDLHGGVPDLPGDKETRTAAAFTTNEEEQNVMFDHQRLDVAAHRKGVLIPTKQGG
jgi:hypothetical protein